MEFLGNLIVFFMFACVVYGILLVLIPFILCAIMSNTKRSADLLAQILLLQINASKQADSDPSSIDNPPPTPTRTIGSFLVFEKPASAPSNTLHKKPAGPPPKSTTLKLGSTYNETDERINPGPEKDGNGPLHSEEPRSD
jgi:hypothetical protein